MEIFFDWELDDKVEQPIHKWVYEDLRTFIKDRYKLLEEEVDRRKLGEVAFVAFIWHDNGGIENKYFFIPDDLVEKLKVALTQEDMDYIMNHIGQKIDKKSTDN
jgi:hypothetical protein